MRLVLQCSVCGTIQHVGASVCETCRATGLQNLRLMFECTGCFRLGLELACGTCDPVGAPKYAASVAAPPPTAPAVPPAPPVVAAPPPPPATAPDLIPATVASDEAWGVDAPSLSVDGAPPKEDFILGVETGPDGKDPAGPDSDFDLKLGDGSPSASDDDMLRIDDPDDD